MAPIFFFRSLGGLSWERGTAGSLNVERLSVIRDFLLGNADGHGQIGDPLYSMFIHDDDRSSKISCKTSKDKFSFCVCLLHWASLHTILKRFLL